MLTFRQTVCALVSSARRRLVGLKDVLWRPERCLSLADDKGSLVTVAHWSPMIVQLTEGVFWSL